MGEVIKCMSCGVLLPSDMAICPECGAKRPQREYNSCETSGCANHLKKGMFTAKECYCDLCEGLTTYGTAIKDFL